MYIFSRKLFVKKFGAHFHEASDKPFPKLKKLKTNKNRNLEVPI